MKETDQKQSVRRRSGYTSIPNSVMSDTRLSIEARGLLALLMTFKEGWVFRSKHLMEQCGVGRDKYYRMIGELKDFGYVTVIQNKTEDGKFLDTYWEISDQPFPEKPDTAEPDSGKSGHIRENNLLSENNNKTPTPTGPGEHDLFSADQGLTSKPPGKKPGPKNSFNQSEFDAFWEAYPRKIGPEPALKNYKRALKLVDAATILAGAKNYAEQVRRAGTETTYIQHPKNWLRECNWKSEDQAAPPSAKPMSYAQRVLAAERSGGRA